MGGSRSVAISGTPVGEQGRQIERGDRLFQGRGQSLICGSRWQGSGLITWPNYWQLWLRPRRHYARTNHHWRQEMHTRIIWGTNWGNEWRMGGCPTTVSTHGTPSRARTHPIKVVVALGIHNSVNVSLQIGLVNRHEAVSLQAVSHAVSWCGC